MSISFNSIPNNIRTPLAYIEVNAANDNFQPNFRMLTLGNMLSSGTATANTPVLVHSYSQAVSLFGQGSQLTNMYKTIFDNNNIIEQWCVPLADASGGVKATGNISFTGPATAAGTISLYIAGVLINVSVSSGDTAQTIATNTTAAINANLDLICTAAVDGTNNYQVNITCRHKGLFGNYIDIRLNYGGVFAGQGLPAGVGATITAMASGTTNPTLTTAISNLPDTIYNMFCHPYNDATSLTAIENEMNRRWGPLVMLEGHAITGANGSVSTLVTLGNSRNNPHSTILDCNSDSPTPYWIWVAAAAAVCSNSLEIDPARPLTTLPLVDVLPPRHQFYRSISDKNSLLYDGIATTNVASGGVVTLERIITTYQLNAFGMPDNSYLDITTPFTLSYMRQDLLTRITTKFPRMKLAANGTIFGAGQAIVTPSIIQAEIVAIATNWVTLGLLQNLADFKANLIVELNANDPTRVDASLPTQLVGPFYIFAAQINFSL